MAKTFSNDASLPPLPLPKLEETLAKYLDSIRPHLSDEEFERAKDKVTSFQQDPKSAKAQAFLEQRANDRKNWMEEWWLDFAYLSSRDALLMGSNFTGIWSGFENPVPFQKRGERTQNRTMAIYLHQTLRFWLGLRFQKFPANLDGRGNPFSMNQYRFLFNTTRSPNAIKDEIKSWFCTAEEGECPNHVVINCEGRYFKLVPFEGNGMPFSVPKLECYLDHLTSFVENNPSEEEALPVGGLTCTDRDIWAEARQELVGLSPQNAQLMECIESSICVASLDEAEPQDDEEMFKFLLSAENIGYRWADKQITLIATKNGLFGSQSEHTPIDGLVSGTLAGVGVLEAAKDKTDLDEAKKDLMASEVKFEVEELSFEFREKRDHFKSLLANTQRRVERKKSDLRIELKKVVAFGKSDLKEVGIHPDTFVQIALQIASYLTHSRPLPTYETATTRAFYNGRTETLRSCTIEALALAEAFKSGDVKKIRETFLPAVKKHDQLMTEGKMNAGCDRHLLGILIASNILGFGKPEFMDDPAFEKSGGNGNFALSTSLCGYTSITGGCAPMIKDGYGIFYGIMPTSVEMWILSHESSKLTDPEGMWKNFEGTSVKLLEMLRAAKAQSKSE